MGLGPTSLPHVLLETLLEAAPGLQGPNTLDIREADNANEKAVLCSLSPWEQKLVLLTHSMARLLSEDKDHCVGRAFILHK